MAGPVASYLRLPDDSAYTGQNSKKMRTQTKVIGSDTVHEHYFYVDRKAQVLGVYHAELAQNTLLQTAQDGTTTGFLWAHVPSAVSNRKVRIRRVLASVSASSAVALGTAPRIVVTRFTFTGAATGAQLVGGKVTNNEQLPQLDLRTAVTGLTVSLVAAMASLGMMGQLSATISNTYGTVTMGELIPWTSEEDEWIILAPGEGVAIYQDTAGTASDTRKVNIHLLWDEIDVA